jgi:2-furoyl-CoA dehydrogenase large subunit
VPDGAQESAGAFNATPAGALPVLADGAVAAATVSIDPLGSVSVNTASVAQGQGHRTVLAQVVGDVLGLPAELIRVKVEYDSYTDICSPGAGNYCSQFAGAVAGAAHLAAVQLRGQIARLAAGMLNVAPEQIGFADARVYALSNADNALPFSQVVAPAHWSPGQLPEGVRAGLQKTVFWTPPPTPPADSAGGSNSSVCYGVVFDFCGVEIDPATAQVRLDRYVTLHDAGTLLHPALADGQIRGAFAQAVGTALYEELVYSAAGSCVSETYADYRVPTACEIPDPLILYRQTPSPYTPLGAKGIGAGNCMSTPVCIANAVADALAAADLTLPLTPARLAPLISGKEPARPQTGQQ